MKSVVIYWSQTGNTETVANYVYEQLQAKGDCELYQVSEFAGNLADYDVIALGCPAMGAEVLEETEFEPFYSANKGDLDGKNVLLFGSFDWGNGQWMRDWADDATSLGANVLAGVQFNLADYDDAYGQVDQALASL